ncbi:MAG: RHS repeat-associated core domain-containing protein, partial [Candidatus Solibacter usitatus]|nr:RHS repeat-associated core domain-containing protein [Candidatus Solibacter usitatus]
VMVYDAAGQLAAEYGGTVMGAGTQYLTADHLGSTRVVTDGTGVPRQCLDYLPFGEEIGQGVGSRPSCYGIAAEPRQKFTGKERDAETGLDNFIARYYSPVQGRFGSADEPLADQDPADPQSWNLYGYVRNNPLRYIDPTGRECVTLDNGSKGDDGQGKFCKDVTDANQKKRPDVTVRDYEPPSPLLLAVARGAQQAGPVVNALAGVTLGFVAGAGIVAGVPAAASAPSFIPQIASFAGKQTARSAIASLGLPAAQAAAAISAIARATSTSSIQIIKQGQDVIVRIARTGANGYQVIESVIDQAGSKHVVQKAYDAANALVHYDPKK